MMFAHRFLIGYPRQSIKTREVTCSGNQFVTHQVQEVVLMPLL